MWNSLNKLFFKNNIKFFLKLKVATIILEFKKNIFFMYVRIMYFKISKKCFSNIRGRCPK